MSAALVVPTWLTYLVVVDAFAADIGECYNQLSDEHCSWDVMNDFDSQPIIVISYEDDLPFVFITNELVVCLDI